MYPMLYASRLSTELTYLTSVTHSIGSKHTVQIKHTDVKVTE